MVKSNLQSQLDRLNGTIYSLREKLIYDEKISKEQKAIIKDELKFYSNQQIQLICVLNDQEYDE